MSFSDAPCNQTHIDSTTEEDEDEAVKVLLWVLVGTRVCVSVCTDSNPGLELRGGDNRNGASMFPKLPLETLLDRHWRERDDDDDGEDDEDDGISLRAVLLRRW